VLSRDKALSKKLLAYHRIPVPEFAVLRRGLAIKRPRRLDFPVIVKSLTQEASIGIAQASVVDDDGKLRERVKFIHESVKTDAIAEHFPATVKSEQPEGGLNVWAALPRKVNTGMKSRFFKQVLDRNVLYVPGGLCYVDDPTRAKSSHEMRLSFGAAPEADIREGIRRLGQAI